MSTSEMQPGVQHEMTSAVGLRYLLFVPEAYRQDPGQRWPLILFLHGGGERGDDLTLVKKHGIPKRVEHQPDFPFVVVSPQCPTDQRWQPTVLTALLDEIERDNAVDAQRIYVTGLSLGGEGTWMLAAAQPHRFAAIAPVCGRGEPRHAATMAHLPVWAFHGAQDTVVPVHHTEEMVAALRGVGNIPRMTIYPNAGHDSWTETYDNPDLYAWFLSQARSI